MAREFGVGGTETGIHFEETLELNTVYKVFRGIPVIKKR